MDWNPDNIHFSLATILTLVGVYIVWERRQHQQRDRVEKRMEARADQARNNERMESRMTTMEGNWESHKDQCRQEHQQIIDRIDRKDNADSEARAKIYTKIDAVDSRVNDVAREVSAIHAKLDALIK